MPFIEVLVDGLTVGSKVHVTGDVVSVPDLEIKSKSAQVKQWGKPRYKEISEKEFTERGGSEEAVAVELTPPAPPEPKEPEKGDEFDSMTDLNVEATLDEVAKFDDAKTTRFIEWEKANAARKGVLGPLGVEVE